MMRIAAAKMAGSRGSALLISLALILILSLVALTTLKTSDMEMAIAGNSVRRTQALLASEAGLARTESVLRAHPAQCNADTLMNWINAATSLPNTSFRVSMESTLPVRKVISFGSAREAQTAIQVLYKYAANPYNIWNNAVFAGHGQDGVSIRGNTGVHGSVHILGNGEPYKDNNGNGTWDSGEPYTDANHDGSYDRPLLPSEVALDMTGTATISNNYLGMWAPLPSRVPPCPTVTYRGETVQSLSAELRVQHGQVVLDGNAKVGQPNAAAGSPAVKEPMDATWVSDGYAGTSATSGVYSDNGYEEDYDLGGLGLVMPNLDDPYTDAGGTTHASYMAFLKSKALVISGDLRIKCGATLPIVSSGSNYIAADVSGNVVAQGTIYVKGNIEIIGDCPLLYDGRFTLVSEGNVTFDTDFYSKGTFAKDDVAGVVSHGKINLGIKASQLRLAGAFFAQEDVLTNKQTQILGTIVSNYFNMTQVPEIFQVPSLVENLPPWMPGADDAYMYAWRRVPKSWTELF